MKKVSLPLLGNMKVYDINENKSTSNFCGYLASFGDHFLRGPH